MTIIPAVVGILIMVVAIAVSIALRDGHLIPANLQRSRHPIHDRVRQNPVVYEKVKPSTASKLSH